MDNIKNMEAELGNKLNEAIELSKTQEADESTEIDVRQCIKNSFEAAGYKCQDCYDGDVRNAMIVQHGKTVIVLVYTDGDIEKHHIDDARKLRSRFKLKECAVATFGTAGDQTFNVFKAGGKAKKALRQKDKKLGRTFQYFMLK